MTDDERLEESLRETLAAKAAPIDHGPTWHPPRQAPVPIARRWRVPLLAAAAVAVIAVATSAVLTHGFQGGTDLASADGNDPAATTEITPMESPTEIPEATTKDEPTSRPTAPPSTAPESTTGDPMTTNDTTASTASTDATTPNTTDATTPLADVPASRAKVCHQWYYGETYQGPSELLAHYLAGKAVPLDLIRDTALAYVPPKTSPDDPELTERINAMVDEIARLTEIPDRDWSTDDLDALAASWSHVMELCSASGY